MKNKIRGIIIKEIELGEDFTKGKFVRIPDEPDTEVYADTFNEALDKFFQKYETDDICLREDE